MSINIVEKVPVKDQHPVHSVLSRIVSTWKLLALNEICLTYCFTFIIQLPTSLGMLKKLWNLSFGGCPVERNLQALLGQKAKKTNAVLGYLKSVKEE